MSKAFTVGVELFSYFNTFSSPIICMAAGQVREHPQSIIKPYCIFTSARLCLNNSNESSIFFNFISYLLTKSKVLPYSEVNTARSWSEIFP